MRRVRLSTEARRQQLIDSARRLFAERGFNGTTTGKSRLPPA